MNSPIEISNTRNLMMGTEQLNQILFPATEIGGSVRIENTPRTDIENRKDPTIQPTIYHLK